MYPLKKSFSILIFFGLLIKSQESEILSIYPEYSSKWNFYERDEWNEQGMQHDFGKFVFAISLIWKLSEQA